MAIQFLTDISTGFVLETVIAWGVFGFTVMFRAFRVVGDVG